MSESKQQRPSLTGWSRKVAAPKSIEEFLDPGHLHQPALAPPPKAPAPVVKTLLGVRIPHELHRRLKRVALETDRRMEDIVAEALSAKLDQIEDRSS